MRTIRRIATAIALAAVLPMAAEAQSGRHFTDSWFWGAKIGNMVFSTNEAGTVFAPQIGAEWLITRTRAGLYLSLDQAFFEEETSFFDPGGTLHQVQIRDARRATAAFFLFPVEWGNLRPYAGAGLALTFIGSARPTGDFASPSEELLVRDMIAEMKDRAAVVGIGGAQIQYRRFSLFGQGVLMPGATTHLMNGGTTWVLEGGIRYNIGSAIESIR